MDNKNIFSNETEVGAQNTRKPKMVPKWALITTAIVLLIVMLVGGIFIGLNINGVDISVKEMSKRLPYLDDIYALIDEYYYKEVDWDKVQDMTIAGMLALDQFSGVSISEMGVPQPKMGITFTHSVYNESFVFDVSKLSPAESVLGVEKNINIDYRNKTITVTDKTDALQNMKIQRGDQLIGMRVKGSDGQFVYTSGVTFSNLQTLLQSANTLELAFLKPNGVTYTASIQKSFFDDVTSTAEYYNMGDLSGNAAYNNVGYISLSEYDVTRIDEFLSALHQFKADGKANKLIFDLRNNGGGDVEMVQKIAPYLMNINNNSPLMQFVDRKGSIETAKPISYDYNNAKPTYIGNSKTNYQIVVLTNSNTASASEATLGLLRYYEPSTYAIGSPTFGKGVAQATFSNVAGKYFVAITTATFNLPVSGGWKNFHGEGMVPDFNFMDTDKLNGEYGKLKANLTEEIDVIKALEYLTK